MPVIKKFVETVQKERDEHPPALDIDGFLPSLGDLDPAGIDKAFREIFALNGADRARVGRYLEAEFLAPSQELEKMIGQQGTAATKKYLAEAFTESETPPEEGQKTVQMLHNIGELRGAAATPMLKAFNEAAAMLTDEEYNSADVMLKPGFAMIDAIAAANFKPNPLRRNNNAPKA